MRTAIASVVTAIIFFMFLWFVLAYVVPYLPALQPEVRVPAIPTPSPSLWENHGAQREPFIEPAVFSSEQLEEMIALAPHYSRTRSTTPHPTRRMTEIERDLWIIEYNVLGGINAQELELYKIVNEIREEYGLPPFILCPRLSMASRLFSYFQVKYHTTGHHDPYYDDLMQRSNFFGAFGSIYMENANSQKWYSFADGSVQYVYLSPQELVDGWMDSPDHRSHILTRDTMYAGFGVDSGRDRVVPTMKTIMPR